MMIVKTAALLFILSMGSSTKFQDYVEICMCMSLRTTLQILKTTLFPNIFFDFTGLFQFPLSNMKG